MNFSTYIQSYSGFPKPHVTYWDFTPILEDPVIFHEAIDYIRQHYKDKSITHIAAIEAKGFILGSVLAYIMQRPLILIRKPGLIPGQTCTSSFIKEYGAGEYQIKNSRFSSGNRFLLIYDILAGSGATMAAIQLLEAQGANVIGCAYIIELATLLGREALQDRDIFSLVRITGDHNALATI